MMYSASEGAVKSLPVQRHRFHVWSLIVLARINQVADRTVPTAWQALVARGC